jgi:YfiR/HmsC-like
LEFLAEVFDRVIMGRQESQLRSFRFDFAMQAGPVREPALRSNFSSPVFVAGLLLILLGLLPTSLLHAAEPSQEYKLKAAFIVNFARFIGWPAGTFAGDDSPLIIATVGTDPFDGALEQAIAGKTIGKRSIEVRHFDSADKIGTCQILFVPQSDKETTDRILWRVSDAHVLTIGDDENFTAVGGIIRFFTADNKMRFEINTDAADQAKLVISSKLLTLAKIFGK